MASPRPRQVQGTVTTSPAPGSTQNVNITQVGGNPVVDAVPVTGDFNIGSTISQSGSLFVEGIRDDIELIFSRDRGVVDVTRLVNQSSVNGTLTHDTTQGRAVFAVPATAGSTCYYQSDTTLVYESGHMMLGSQTIEPSAVPTGNGKIEWGFGESNGSGALLNAIGIGVDATGVYAFRIKAGAYIDKVYSTSWDTPLVGFDILKNNIIGPAFEWYGVASPQFFVADNRGFPYLVHTVKTAGQITGTTIPEPNLPMFVRIQNDSVSGQVLSVSSGCWKGGILTSQIGNAQLSDKGNSTTMTSASGTMFSGIAFNTRARGVQENLLVIASNVLSGLGATAIFRYPDAGIEEALPITDFSTVRNIGWLSNAGNTFQVEVTLTRPLVGSEAVFITTTHSKLVGNRFVRGPTQQLEIANHLMPTEIAFLEGFDENGKSGPTKHTRENGRVIPHVNVDNLQDDILLRGLDTPLDTNVSLAAGVVSQLDPVQVVARRAWEALNSDLTDTVRVYSQSAALAAPSLATVLASGWYLFPRTPMGGAHSDAVKLWATVSGSAVATVLTRTFGAATGTATNPTNELTDNNLYATYSAVGQTVEVTGATAGTANPLARVRIGRIARKASSPATETVSNVGSVVTGVAGNTLTTVSGTVTASADTLYVVRMARRKTTSQVVSVVDSLGELTWLPAGTDATGTDARASLWYAYGSPSANFTVTVTYSEAATHSVIAVTRHQGVNASSPFQSYEAITGNSTGYSDTLAGTALGMLLVGAAFSNQTHTAGSGATESSETASGTGSNTSTLATTFEAIASTGNESYSGTFSSSVGWAVIAVTLAPSDTLPVVWNMTYDVSEVVGATSGSLSFSSTSEETQYVDITNDRAPWVVADIPNTDVQATLSAKGAANGEGEQIFLELTDTTGAIAIVAMRQIA